MMKAVLKRVLLAAVLGLFGASAASAQSQSWNVCGGNIFNTCAAVTLSVVNSNTMAISVQNLSGTNGTFANTVFTAIGFSNLNVAAVYNLKKGQKFYAGSSTMTGPSIGNPGAWIVQNNTVVGGGLQLNFAGTTNNGIGDGIASNCATAGGLPGGNNSLWASVNAACSGAYSIANATTNSGWVTFSFSVGSVPTLAQLGQATLLVKGQNGPNGQSTELICPPGGSSSCTTITTNVAPEPMSVALVGTGLLGLLFVSRRRRKES